MPGPGCHTPRGHSSAGRAPALHAGGQEFDPPWLHHRVTGGQGTAGYSITQNKKTDAPDRRGGAWPTQANPIRFCRTSGGKRPYRIGEQPMKLGESHRSLTTRKSVNAARLAACRTKSIKNGRQARPHAPISAPPPGAAANRPIGVIRSSE